MKSSRKWKPASTLKDAIRSFMVQSGLNRKSVQDQVGQAWLEAVGPAVAKRTNVSRTIKRGVLTVEVESSALLGELSGFRKPEILRTMQERVKREFIEDIRFKLGVRKKSENT